MTDRTRLPDQCTVTRPGRPALRVAVAMILTCLLVSASGCDSTPAYFRANLVEMKIRQSSDEPLTDDAKLQSEIASALLALFGDPDYPADPFIGDAPVDKEIAHQESPLARYGFDVEKLRIAAGPVYSDAQGRQHGLYRLHCAHCHGVTGDGAGPTAAFVNPYPRDYRQGIFKFKSTFGDAKPTHDDLRRLLIDGAPGTAMPSFKLLPENEIEALIEYVRYLSVRGQTEIRLIEYVADEGELPPMSEIAGGFPMATDEEGIPTEEPDYENIVASIVYSWGAAPNRIIQPVTPQVDVDDPQQLAESLERGRKLFYGQTLKCNSCHGDAALGDGETSDYSAWFQWRKAMVGEPPEEIAASVAQFMELGALHPRTIHPRNLRLGVFRGGRRPIDIYRRVYTGIYGTPMQAFGKEPGIVGDEMPEEEYRKKFPNDVSRQEVWDVVNYVLALQYEPLSRGPVLREGSRYTPR